MSLLLISCIIILGVFWFSIVKPYFKDNDHPKDE